MGSAAKNTASPDSSPAVALSVRDRRRMREAGRPPSGASSATRRVTAVEMPEVAKVDAST